MPAIVTTDIREAAAAIEAIERDIAAIAAARTDLTGRLPALRAERTQAAHALLLAAGPRKAWSAALQAEQEAAALLDDMTVLAALLETDLVHARYRADGAKHEAHTAGLAQRLRRIATENALTLPATADFLGDVMHAYEWLGKVGRTATVDRAHAHTFWLDRMGSASRNHVSTQAFIAAAMCHGDIKIELGDCVTSFGIAEYIGKPAASLPLNGDPTPSTNRALITKVEPARF